MLVSLCKANRDEYITGITPAGIIAAIHSTMRFFETHCTRWQHVFLYGSRVVLLHKNKRTERGHYHRQGKLLYSPAASPLPAQARRPQIKGRPRTETGE